MDANVRKIEQALVEAFRYRVSGCDISTDTNGTRYARVYHHGCPSQHGGSSVAADVNLTGLAIDLERALS